MADETASSGKTRRLSDVVREVKIAAAEREDVVVDMKEADRARLELLAEELAPVFEQVPEDDDQFDFVLSSGLQPRLWIDAIAHVQMGPDRRTYRFVRDTRYGREVLAETSDIMRAADSVTHYVAERIVHRQRYLANNDRAPDVYQAMLHEAQATSASDPKAGKPKDAAQLQNIGTPRGPRVPGLLWFFLGAIVGAGALAIAFRDQIGLVLNMI